MAALSLATDLGLGQPLAHELGVLRIVRVAQDFVAVAHARDPEAAIAVLGRRRGRGYDPEVVDAVLAEPEALLRAADVPDAFGRVIDAEPQPVATISRAGLESV